MALPQTDLTRAIASARVAWPELDFDEARLRGFLADRVGPDTTNVVDLALVFACLEGDARAQETFRIEYGPVVRKGLDRLGSPVAEVADLEQMVWERILVGTPQRSPKLADYAGSGPLLHWLRVVLVRMRADVLRRRARTPTSDGGDAGDLADRIDDPEFAYLKGHYRGLVKAALAEAFQTLEPRSKTALRLHVLDGLSTEQIGRVHGVHAATARRWIAKARAELLEGTRIAIAREGGVQASEFESVVRLVRSRLDLSLGALLRDG